GDFLLTLARLFGGSFRRFPGAALRFESRLFLGKLTAGFLLFARGPLLGELEGFRLALLGEQGFPLFPFDAFKLGRVRGGCFSLLLFLDVPVAEKGDRSKDQQDDGCENRWLHLAIAYRLFLAVADRPFPA